MNKNKRIVKDVPSPLQEGENGKVVVVAFIQGHDMINYRLIERICNNVWKRPS